MAENTREDMRCTSRQLLPRVPTARLTFLSRTYLERLGRFPDGPRKEVMQFSEDIEHTPFKSTSKKILTADLLAVRSVANNFGEIFWGK